MNKTKPGKTRELASKISGRGEIRTRDQRLMSPLLYRLSYPANTPIIRQYITFKQQLISGFIST